MGFGPNPLYSQQITEENQASSSFSEETAFSTKEALKQLRGQLKQYVDSLMLVFINEETPVENQLEILHEMKGMADLNGAIATALDQMDQKGIEYKGQEADIKDKKISLWAKTKSEQIKRKLSELDKLEDIEKDLKTEFYINLAVDGVVIVSGAVLMFIPAGQAVSVLLFSGRLALTANRLRSLGGVIATAGGVGIGAEAYSYYLSEENQEVLSFISSLVFKEALSKEIFNILISAKESDKYLAVSLFKSVNEEAFVDNLLKAINNERFSPQARLSSIRALLTFQEIGEELGLEIIKVLKKVIDSSNIPELRETAVGVLGEIGEGQPEVAEYLQEIGDNEEESNKIRIIALIQLGRSLTYFDSSIKLLAKWFENENYESQPPGVTLKIPDSFVDSLLGLEKWRVPEAYILVLQEFIRLEILKADVKLSFSETLIHWDNTPDSKALLEEALASPAKDTALYVEQLSEKMLSEENYQAFEFLKTEIDKLKDTENTTIVLQATELIINKFEKDYSHQTEILKKIRIFLENYMKIQENIKRLRL